MHEGHARDVEQVYLRCSQGSLEWLYPTGAIIVNLRPNTISPGTARLSVCIKPSADSRGTNIYLDRTGELRLLMREEDQALGKVQCFSIREGALFIEAVPHMDISRRTTAFQYELLSNRPGPDAHWLGGKMDSRCNMDHFRGQPLVRCFRMCKLWECLQTSGALVVYSSPCGQSCVPNTASSGDFKQMETR